MTAFFLTFKDALFVTARSIIESERALTSKSGTIVAIIESANDWAASFLDRISAYIECTIVLQI